MTKNDNLTNQNSFIFFIVGSTFSSNSSEARLFCDKTHYSHENGCKFCLELY